MKVVSMEFCFGAPARIRTLTFGSFTKVWLCMFIKLSILKCCRLMWSFQEKALESISPIKRGLEVAGSNPAPGTNKTLSLLDGLFKNFLETNLIANSFGEALCCDPGGNGG